MIINIDIINIVMDKLWWRKIPFFITYAQQEL